MGYLKWIEIENFKSYKNCQKLRFLKPFTAIIGPNGSGKSNFMDAISFVLGEKTSCLRVDKLNKLIHGVSAEVSEGATAHVTAIFCDNDNSEWHFTRKVVGYSTEYKINGTMVCHTTYVNKLQSLGINIKAKNFLVFQGTVDSIAVYSPKEYTRLFEELSHSIEYKKDYERLKVEMIEVEDAVKLIYRNKKNLNGEKKKIELEKKEAEKYQLMKDELAEKRVSYYLFLLFHNERIIANIIEELESKHQVFQELSQKKEKMQKEIKQGKIPEELLKFNQCVKKSRSESFKQSPTYIQTQEKIAYVKRRLEHARKSLEEAEKNHELHEREIESLKKELEDIEINYRMFCEQLYGELKLENKDLTLQNLQVEEYNRLKEKASKLSSNYLQDLDAVSKNLKFDQDHYNNEILKKSQVEDKIKQKQSELDENYKRLGKINDYIHTNEAGLSELRAQENNFKGGACGAEESVTEINEKLETIIQELTDAKVDKNDEARRRKKIEIVDHFKKLYPGVYDRLINLCRPIHKRYNIAITKVLGRNMDAIVVDTECTAQSCIQYLKRQALGVETFLPLDYIDAKPLNEQLRNIQDPKNAKLVYDVLQYDPPSIKKAVLYATNNALICETDVDACKMAYENAVGRRYDVVALDGTYYQKNGFISGGSTDLAKRALCWDEKELHSLKYRKEKLMEELKEVVKKRRNESDVILIQFQIQGLETRIKYSITDKENLEKKIIGPLQKEVAELENELHLLEPEIMDLDNRIQANREKLQRIQGSIDAVEDEVFADFCESIGVVNIRQYEGRDLQAVQEHDKKKLEFENKKYLVMNRLEYEKSKDTYEDVEKWAKIVSANEQELEKIETICIQLMNEEMQEVETFSSVESVQNAGKDSIDDAREEIDILLDAFQKDMTVVQNAIFMLQTKLKQKKVDKQGLLQFCKLEDIRIPMIKGTMEDIDYADFSEIDNYDITESSACINTNVDDETIRINYEDLANDLKDLLTEVEINCKMADLMTEINDMTANFQKIQIPNVKTVERLANINDDIKKIDKEYENTRKRARVVKQAFERVKRNRYDQFMNCFECISSRIDQIYKDLNHDQSAQAFLGPENSEEPYLDGVTYLCIPPSKRFQPINNMSSGEKTIAALSLLFAMHSYQPAPFFVLDEIDAALDRANVRKVTRFIREQTRTSLQCIVISLNEELYGHADCLVGIASDPGTCTISRLFTLDLTEHDEE